MFVYESQSFCNQYSIGITVKMKKCNNSWNTYHSFWQKQQRIIISRRHTYEVVHVLNCTLCHEEMRWSGDVAAHILNLCTGWFWVKKFHTPVLLSKPKKPFAPVEYDAVWPPELFWTLWLRAKSVPSGNERSHNHPARKLLAVLTGMVYFKKFL